jgi:hypothetical protein
MASTRQSWSRRPSSTWTGCTTIGGRSQRKPATCNGLIRRLQEEHDVATLVSTFDVAVSSCHVPPRVGPIDDGCQAPLRVCPPRSVSTTACPLTRSEMKGAPARALFCMREGGWIDHCWRAKSNLRRHWMASAAPDRSRAAPMRRTAASMCLHQDDAVPCACHCRHCGLATPIRDSVALSPTIPSRESRSHETFE